MNNRHNCEDWCAKCWPMPESAAPSEPVAACPECGGVTMCRSTCSREAAFVQAVGEESDAIRRIVATLIHQVPQVDGVPMHELAVEYIVQETRRLSRPAPREGVTPEMVERAASWLRVAYPECGWVNDDVRDMLTAALAVSP